MSSTTIKISRFSRILIILVGRLAYWHCYEAHYGESAAFKAPLQARLSVFVRLSFELVAREYPVRCSAVVGTLFSPHGIVVPPSPNHRMQRTGMGAFSFGVVWHSYDLGCRPGRWSGTLASIGFWVMFIISTSFDCVATGEFAPPAIHRASERVSLYPPAILAAFTRLLANKSLKTTRITLCSFRFGFQ